MVRVGDLILGEITHHIQLLSNSQPTVCARSGGCEGLVGCSWILDNELQQDDRIAVEVSIVRLGKSYVHLLVHADV